ncbi:ABC transporter permease [Thermomonospora cellulosilytica]|uniref:Uncharacterized protein n=1 Tax=Thermomonospora cellulosilytica TaxID=1411118 RepID=A0A7W3RAM1_9ACTN|nr:ABC transporter permease [Thermomonospora cellulosilytica]MBA9006568.1 hypothetical protein [Thermomonospora cellulosilytica]
MSALAAAVAAEWTKLRTVRSSHWSLAAVFALSVGLGALVGGSFRAQWAELPADQREQFDAAAIGLYGVGVGQLAVVVFGVLAVGAEYGSGTIRASLAAMPRRGVFFGAKVLAVAAAVLPVALATAFAAFIAAQSALGPYGTGLGAPGALRATLGAAAYLTLICVFATGVAMMLRGSARALGLLLPLLFLGSQGLANVPGIRAVGRCLPDQAGLAMLVTGERGLTVQDPLAPAAGAAVLLAWTTAALTGGYLVLRRRDA